MKNKGSFKDFNNYYQNDELLANDKYLNFANSQNNILYSKKDLLFRGGVWRNEFQESLVRRVSKSKPAYVISGHSDISGNMTRLAILKSIGVEKFFGTNTFPIRSFSHPLPTGLCDLLDNTPVHKVLGDNRLLSIAHETTDFPSNFIPEIDLNFTVANNPERKKIMTLLQKYPQFKVKSKAPELTKSSRTAYLSNCRSASFVICPRGNGHDTHRLWETLYMGGIPIVKSNPYINSLTLDLPVLTINRWSEITDVNFLERRWYQIQESEYNWEKLSYRYWTSYVDSIIGDSDE